MRRLLALVLVPLLAGCVLTGGEATDARPPVRVAAGPDAEAALLAHVAVALLDVHDVEAEMVSFADARDARQALELGEVDVHIGYTGEAWLEIMGRADPPGDPRESYEAVRAHDQQRGITWLRPRFAEGMQTPPANATFAFVVQGPPSVDADIHTMSQLASRLSAQPDALVCVDRAFAERIDGLAAVLSAYSVRSDRPFLAADPAQAVLGVVAGDCLAGLSTTTDGNAWRAGLRPVFDDLRVFPAFVPLPLVREDAVRTGPEVTFALAPFASRMTTPLLGRWNARVRAGEPIEAVARDAARELVERSGRLQAAG